MRQQIITFIGKSVRKASQLRGGGSALPGLVIERLDPAFMARTLRSLEHGVVLVTGTNGKTTTTKIVVELLESQGLQVFTNRTGSNFTRGIVAALLGAVDRHGNLPHDIAVLELDEAYAVKFVEKVRPSYALFLNVLRDQLDRFGEIDATADMLRKVAEKTTHGIVINRDDPRLMSPAFTQQITARIHTYGISPAIAKLFPSDDDMRSGAVTAQKTTYDSIDDTCLMSLENQAATIRYGDYGHAVQLKLKGLYNIQNATGAVALTRLICGDTLDEPSMFDRLATVTPAFGRGEDIMINGQPVELVLVKNPSGFRLSLQSFDPTGTATMIAVNDNYADGRDMSWLWDVDFDSLRTAGVATVSGIRAYDMALRLQYDEVEPHHVEPDLAVALSEFLSVHASIPKRIYCTYTAMLALRRQLAKLAQVEKVL